MKLAQQLPQSSIIQAVAEEVRKKYPDPKGLCEFISQALVEGLRKRGIYAQHAVGNFHLDEPGAFEFIGPKRKSHDDCIIEHGWVEVEGKIVDASASQFRKYVHVDIPEIAIIDYRNPLFEKYETLKYV